LTLLVRARVFRPLLAWRGLANSVTLPTELGETMHLPNWNDIAGRRLHQLFVPGLADLPRGDALQLEQAYPLDAEDSLRGFLYVLG
jgi:hypothetical protein